MWVTRWLRAAFVLALLGAALAFLFRQPPAPSGSASIAENAAGLNNPAPETAQAAQAPGPSVTLTPDEAINIRVYQDVSPGVVNITSRVVEYDFFFDAVLREGASGSGSIIDYDGNIVTNYHVIEGAEQLEVTLPDQSKWRAAIVGTDERNDLAVIKITAPRDKLRPLRFGDSQKLRVGQKVLAIGNPFRLHNTLTAGIISSLGRTIKAPNGTLFEDIIQTDAGLNPGNSGGPLLNSAGELIGVNTLIFSPSGGNIGLGFAIPIAKVQRIVNDLVRFGQVRRPSLGILAAYTITADLAEILDLPVKEGVLLVQLQQGGAADQAGLRGGSRRLRYYNNFLVIGGDIITAVNGQKVESVEALSNMLEDNHKPSEEITVDILRSERRMQVKVVLQGPPAQRQRRL